MFHVLYLQRDKASLNLNIGLTTPNENELHNLYKVVRQFKDKPDDIRAFLENVFVHMQAESWSPNGEQHKLITDLGLQHTSMSVGDIIYDDETTTFWHCAGMRFSEFEVVDLDTGQVFNPGNLAKLMPLTPKHPLVQQTWIERPPLTAVEQFYEASVDGWVF
jgi:hypothetical protein